MAVLDRGISALSQALLEQGFHAVDEFDVFVTFARDNDPLRIHAGPDGAFAVFDSDDELITDGEGAEDLYRILVTKTEPISQRRRPHRRGDRSAPLVRTAVGLSSQPTDNFGKF
jgi:hypothetical protein